MALKKSGSSKRRGFEKNGAGTPSKTATAGGVSRAGKNLGDKKKSQKSRSIAKRKKQAIDAAGSTHGRRKRTCHEKPPVSDRGTIRHSEDLFMQAFLANPVPTAVSEISTGVFLLANPAFTSLTGYSEKEVIGRSSLDLNIWHDQADRERIIKILNEKGSVHGEKAGINSRDRGVRTCLFSARIIVLHDRKYALSMTDDITDRTHAEEKYSTVIDSIQEGYFETDVAGHLTFVNNSLCDIMGYTRDELTGLTYRQLSKSQHYDLVYGAFNRVYTSRKPEQGFDWEILRKDGTSRTVEISISLILDGAVMPAGFRGIVHDITERKRAELESIQSREALRDVLEKSPMGIFKTSPPGTFSYVNPAMASMFGYGSADEFMSSVTDIARQIYYLPGDRDRFFRLLADGEFSGEEFLCVHKSGRPFWTMASCRAIRDDAGDIAGVDGFIVDVTTRKEAEEKLEWELLVNRILTGFSERMLDKDLTMPGLARSAIDFVMGLTAGARVYVTLIDPATGKLVGRGRSIRDSDGMAADAPADGDREFTPGDPADINEPFYDNGPRCRDLFSRVTGWQVDVDRMVAAPAVMRGELLGFITAADPPREFTARDLDAVKRLAALYAIAINRMRSEVQIQSSLREKELLLKEIHHRVKNNMQIISSLLGLQSAHVKDPKDVELFEDSQRRVRSMALVHEKLYQSENLTGVNFREYITELANELSNSYSLTAGRVELRINADDVYINLDDAIPCSLIIYELISNAYKHAFPEGREGSISIDLHRTEDRFHLRIADDGIGFPPGFDFMKSETLGLKLVTALVQQLSGTVELYREGGTVFTITFRGQQA